MTAPALRRVREVDGALLRGLADLLVTCVEGGASVSFMHPLAPGRAGAFWDRVAADVAAGRRALIVAEDAGGPCGSVQLVLDQHVPRPKE